MILIVDDQESMCWILSKVLSESGFSVKTAETAKEACDIVDSGGVSAAIIDYRLPDMNGFELFLELKKRNHNIPAVLITSYGSRELKEDALRLGFRFYFDKPFDNRSLVATLRAILNDVGNQHPKLGN